MDRIRNQLRTLCEKVEKQLKAKLSLPIGTLVRQYLPQTWVFETELGASTILIDTDGNAKICNGAQRERDVTLIWRYDSLAKVLASMDFSSMRPDDYPTILAETEKGRAAFNYLKKEFRL